MTKLEARPSRNGTGVFAVAAFAPGELVWDWSADRRYTAEQIPVPYVKDEYLQVAPNLYVGPDGRLDSTDDFINHSCSPNCVIEVSLPSVRLVTIRAIQVGEEITYDYAATMFNDQWSILCNCGESCCRGTIKEGLK